MILSLRLAHFNPCSGPRRGARRFHDGLAVDAVEEIRRRRRKAVIDGLHHAIQEGPEWRTQWRIFAGQAILFGYVDGTHFAIGSLAAVKLRCQEIRDDELSIRAMKTDSSITDAGRNRHLDHAPGAGFKFNQ